MVCAKFTENLDFARHYNHCPAPLHTIPYILTILLFRPLPSRIWILPEIPIELLRLLCEIDCLLPQPPTVLVNILFSKFSSNFQSSFLYFSSAISFFSSVIKLLQSGSNCFLISCKILLINPNDPAGKDHVIKALELIYSFFKVEWESWLGLVLPIGVPRESISACKFLAWD